MSSDVRRVDSALVESGFSLELKRPTGKCAGFVLKVLVGDDGDFTRGTQVVIVKQPGVRHPIVATEQYVTTFGGKPYLEGDSWRIGLDRATELAPVPHGGLDTHTAAILIGAELLAQSQANTAE